jgi:hypothetical protein
MTSCPSSARALGAFVLVLPGACLGAALLACGGRTTTTDDGAGSAEFYVMNSVPAAGSSTGASYQRSVTFTALGQSGCSATSSTPPVGPCSVNPCVAPAAPDGGTETLPSAGPITIDGAQMPPLTLEPDSDGAYPPDVVKGQLPWSAGGVPVTFQWAHVPGAPSSAGGSVVLATPPYIALMQGSAFADRPTTLARDQDLTVSWTSDTTPTSADQVAVDLDSGSVQIVCIFTASAGTGVVPAAALGLVPAGMGSYNIHSKQAATNKSVGGSGWSFGFNVDAQARASSGLAQGAVTFE